MVQSSFREAQEDRQQWHNPKRVGMPGGEGMDRVVSTRTYWNKSQNSLSIICHTRLTTRYACIIIRLIRRTLSTGLEPREREAFRRVRRSTQTLLCGADGRRLDTL